jgi:RNA polymerase sigma factor (TIGR02999 family)
MGTVSPKDVTQLLFAWSNGDKEALNRLIPLVYEELHRLAARYMRRENPGHSLQTTDLVNEAYCRLIEQKDVRWQNRAHFYGISAQMMRRILVDRARSRRRAKRGGAAEKISLDETAVIPQPQSSQIILLDDALTHLAQFDPQKSRIVELKFFGGLTTEEIAEVEQLSIRMVEREWRKARAWLYDAILR